MTSAPPTHTYRIAFWRMYIGVAVYAQVLYVPGMWAIFYLLSLAYRAPFPTTDEFILSVAGSAGVALVLLPAFFFYVRLLVVRVSADGLTCSNGVGRLRKVPWTAITRVKALHIPGFPYLLLTTDRSRLKLWLPLFLRELPEFAEKVEQFAGADHMLYRAFWPRVEQK